MVRALTLLGLVAVSACGSQPRPLRLGTTTTVEQSGMLAVAESLWTGPRLPTFRALVGLRLRVLFTGDSILRNTYTLYLVRTAAPHPAGRGFVAWAMQTWRAHIGAGFTPRPGACVVPS